MLPEAKEMLPLGTDEKQLAVALGRRLAEVCIETGAMSTAFADGVSQPARDDSCFVSPGSYGLAPLRPGGSMLALKALPLLLPLRGILHGRRYTYQWTSLLVLLYLAEGLVRSHHDLGLSQWLAMAEISPGNDAVRRLPRPCSRYCTLASDQS
jgi:hypothetical protein